MVLILAHFNLGVFINIYAEIILDMGPFFVSQSDGVQSTTKDVQVVLVNLISPLDNEIVVYGYQNLGSIFVNQV